MDWKIRGGIVGGLALFATILINLVPDPSAKISLALVFGIIFGMAWMVKSIKGIVYGMVFGVLATVAIAFTNALPQPTAPEMTLTVDLIKLIVPFTFYATDLGIPLLTD